MQHRVVTAKSELTLREASRVMKELRIGSLVVMEEDKIVGILTSTDLLKAVADGKDPEQVRLSEVMSPNVVTVKPDTPLEDAVELMVDKKVKRLPVVEDGKLVGIVTASDIIVVEPKLIQGIANLLSLKFPGYKGG